MTGAGAQARLAISAFAASVLFLQPIQAQEIAGKREALANKAFHCSDGFRGLRDALDAGLILPVRKQAVPDPAMEERRFSDIARRLVEGLDDDPVIAFRFRFRGQAGYHASTGHLHDPVRGLRADADDHAPALIAELIERCDKVASAAREAL